MQADSTATDYVKGALDSAASVVQPQEEKSTTQKIGDSRTFLLRTYSCFASGFVDVSTDLRSHR